eukprot:TRINITY_DN10755_c0_g1_i1.p1 TRINITY_DN10755_c0_g1~~TRINITY_DN10755_c0_g1_i1.p1  ORF type:complete len:219 (+),score=67.02 TRINITY_DN10755_c0_g1_i1:33-659(+)
MGEFSSSEDEFENLENFQPRDEFRVDWVNLYRVGLHDSLALGALPGCRFREHRRNLHDDLNTIVKKGVTDVMVLMKDHEFRKYRVPYLLDEYSKYGLSVHHHPMEDGCVPTFPELLAAIASVRSIISSGGRLLIHCYGGLGRTCLVAATFLMTVDPSLAPETVIQLLRGVRGPRAVQTVRQYNMIMEFRSLHMQGVEGSYDRSRSVSR